MDNKQMLTWIAALLTTAEECAVRNEPMPLGPAYMALMTLGCTLDDLYVITGLCSKLGWAEVTSETMMLTQAGREKAQQINAKLTKTKEKVTA